MSSRRGRAADPAALARRSAATAMKAGETLNAAATVIAARTELAALAAANPSLEAGREMNLMVSEKVEAFSESGAALAKGAQTMASRGARYVVDEAAAASRGMSQLAGCKSPLEVMLTQSRLMTDFFTRAMTHGHGLNAVATRTGERVLAPVHKAVTANSKRLKRD